MAKPQPVERQYEGLFICPIEVSQKALDVFIEKVKTTLTEAKATVRSVQVWGRRRLTYPIKHQRDGLYIYVDFNGVSESLTALKALFHVTDIVLRHMITERVELRPPYVRKTPTMDGAPSSAAAATATAVAPASVDAASSSAASPTSSTPPSAPK